MRIGHGRGNLYLARVFVLAAGVLIAATLAPRSGAAAFSEQTLYRFCPQSGCADGAQPVAGLIMDAAGNLYGTTLGGGVAGRGVVFQLMPDPTGTAWTETVFYNFCSQPSCADGADPRAGLIMDAAGNLYGTTSSGGNGSSGGVVFQLTPDPTGTAWTETVLYNFCSQSGCADGARPEAGLIMDAAGNLYGTTRVGGNGSSGGVVFALNASLTARGQRSRQR